MKVTFAHFPKRKWLPPILIFLVGVNYFGSQPVSAATLLKYNFESTNVWSAMTGYFQSTGGTGTCTPSVTPVGTVNSYGTSGNTDVNNIASNGLKLLVDSSAATGTWTAGVDSGVLPLLTANTITNTGLLTLSFSLWSSKANPILVRMESYDGTTNLRTGGLKTLIYPAAPNYYQRFAIDLSTMTADGGGAFVPNNNSKIKVFFELSNTLGGDGWPNSGGLELHIDNINYANPKYYVKPSSPGLDTNSGLTETAPWRTIDKAVNAATPGDIIVLMGSESDQFMASPDTTTLASFENPGTPDAWIVLKNYPGQKPVLRSAAWNVVYIGRGSNGARWTSKIIPCYIEVRGLTIRGYSSADANGDRQILAAYKNYVGLADSRSNSNGLSIDGRFTDYYLHDFRLADNTIEYCTGGGISAIRSDRTATENNISRYNTWWSIYGGSGISYLVSTDTELNTETRSLIQGNQSYGNEGMIPWRTVNGFSDGNGIIADTNQVTKSNYNVSNAPDYAGRTLIQNNLVYNNGGSGIHAFQSSHVDIVYNVAYRNSASPRLLYSQIYAGYSSDVRMMNNILVAPNNPTGSSSFNEPITTNGANTAGTIYYQNNVFYGEGNNQSLPTNANFINNITTNPLFLSPSVDPATNDFHLRSNSPTLNNGLALAYRSVLDFANRPRPTTNLTPDRGAYQSQAGDIYAPVFTPQPGNYATTQSVTLASDSTATKIVYTTNGTDPIVDASGNPINGNVYTAAISVGTGSATLKAIAWKLGSPTSYVSVATYTFSTALVAIPALTFDISPTTDTGTQYVSVISATPGALVRYTTDGTTPATTTGTLATANAIPIISGNIIKAIAYKAGRGNSAVLSGNFVVRPRIGSLSEGSTTETFGLNKIRFSRFKPVSNLTVAKIYARVGAIAGNYRAAIYADTNSLPGALLRASSAAVTNPSAGWQAFSLSSPLALVFEDSKGTDLYYWLAIWSDTASASIYTTTTGGNLRETTSTFGGTWPSTAPASTATANPAYNYSIFATTNYRPVVSAGANQTIPNPSTIATLTGIATDNSTPSVPLKSGVLTTAWSKFSGPGTVTFANTASPTTTATFSTAGTYVLRLTGTDTIFTPFAPVTSDVTITVSPLVAGSPTNTDIQVGSDVVTLGNSVTFTATVTSSAGTPNGTVTFYDGGASIGSATLSASGIGTLSTTNLSVGSHAVTAIYAGNTTYATSESPDVTTTVFLLDGTTRTLAINSAGSAIGGSGFIADANFTGGALTSTTAAINRTTVSNPAPQGVYQTERYGTFGYNLTGLTPFTAYLVRLHFSENFFGVGTRTNLTVSQRLFNVAINGIERLTSFDIWATAGASNKAVIKEYATLADETGQVSLNFVSVLNNALVDGLELYTLTPYDTWRVGSFLPNQLDDPSISGITADYDKDGLITLLEYALDSDPLTNTLSSLPQAGLDESGNLTISFLRARSEITYIVESSNDLSSWTTVATNPGVVGDYVTISDIATAPDTRRFLRLKVIRLKA